MNKFNIVQLLFLSILTLGHSDELLELSGFNAPARTKLQSGWDIWTNCSFLYWKPTQDNIELGQAIDQLTFLPYKPHPGVFRPRAFNTDTAFVNIDFEYTPGFKIGIGSNLGLDNWDVSTEYTWLHGSDHKSSNGGEFGLFPNVGDDLSVDYIVSIPGPSTSSYGNGKASWHFGIDLIDADLGRSFYSGKSLKFRPFFGLRSAWIDQHLHGTYFLAENNATFKTKLTSQSWGLGPRTGFQGNWVIFRGLRLFGNGSLDLLFTDYDLKSRNQVTNPSLNPPEVFFNANQSDLHLSAKTHAEMELGLGWGSYFNSERWHFDLSLGYDFQVFFNQNMFRKLIRVNVSNGPGSISFTPNGNLYIQGLTIKTKYDY